MGTRRVLSPEKWICTYLSNFSNLDIIEEYLQGLVDGTLSTDGLPALDCSSNQILEFDSNLDNAHKGNPIPRPVQAMHFDVFRGDYLDEEGSRLRRSKFHKNKFPEYSIAKSQVSYLYDIIVR
jgi:hypothetical protein